MNDKPVGKYKRVLQILPKGMERPVTASEIASITGLTKRAVYEIISSLIKTYGIPVGGLREDGKHGYFIITTEQERVIALAPLKKHTSEMESRIKKVEEIVI